MRIEYLGLCTNTGERWQIGEKEILLLHRVNISSEAVAERIREYGSVLEKCSYMTDSALLPDFFRFFGGLGFVRLGLAFGDCFKACFAYYADVFALEWKNGNKSLRSKNIGCAYVFEAMLPGVKYDFRYILDETEDSGEYCRIVDRAFEKIWLPTVKERMQNVDTLAEVCRRVGAVRTFRYMNLVGDTEKYLQSSAHKFTEHREVISITKLQKSAFGEHIRLDDDSSQALRELLRKVTASEKNIQYERFPSENRRAMSYSSDMWVLYEKHGLELYSVKLDFTKIPSIGMRSEAKAYYKHMYSGHIGENIKFNSSFVRAVTILVENDARITGFADVTLTDAKRLQMTLEEQGRSQSAIYDTFSLCRCVVEYLRSDERDAALTTSIPSENVFKRIKFVNCKRFVGTTPYMPDEVMDGICTHLDELSFRDALVFRIMTETAMRADEVSRLEADCLSDARYEKYVKLSYVPYKTAKSRRKIGISDKHDVYISHELAADIRAYAEETAYLRKEYSLPYLFLQEKTGRSSSMLDMSGYALRINKLIEKHRISGHQGNLWHYSNHQCRKTVAVNMVENGASSEELTYKLGHLSRSTAMKYYAEVRSARLAEMNGEFFRKQFEVKLSESRLERFSEEERRQLYVDFRLGLRRVEFGLCLKKPGGVCRHTAVHCASCKELCTGAKYLSHWKSLLESESDGLKLYVSACEADGSSDFTDHAEYKRRKKLCEMYADVIKHIEEECHE